MSSGSWLVLPTTVFRSTKKSPIVPEVVHGRSEVVLSRFDCTSKFDSHLYGPESLEVVGFAMSVSLHRRNMCYIGLFDIRDRL